MDMAWRKAVADSIRRAFRFAWEFLGWISIGEALVFISKGRIQDVRVQIWYIWYFVRFLMQYSMLDVRSPMSLNVEMAVICRARVSQD